MGNSPQQCSTPFKTSIVKTSNEKTGKESVLDWPDCTDTGTCGRILQRLHRRRRRGRNGCYRPVESRRKLEDSGTARTRAGSRDASWAGQISERSQEICYEETNQ